MLEARALRPLAVAAAMMASGCSSSFAIMQAQHVAIDPADGAHFWVTGSLGFVAEGRGVRLSRADFPESSDEPDWAFEANMFPGAHVVTQGGRTYLVTHGGSVFRRERREWRRLRTHVPSESPDWPVQVNQVLASPDGELIIHAHAQRLWHAGGQVLEQGGMRPEEMPKYIWSLAFVRGRIVGTSYDGDLRAIFERVAPAEWEVRGVLPSRASDVLAVVPFGERGLAAVTYYGLHVVDEPGIRVPTRFVRIDDLVDLRMRAPTQPPSARPLVVAGDAPSAPLESGGDAPTPSPEALPSPVVAAPRAPAQAERERTDGAPIQGAFVLPSGSAALVVGAKTGTVPGVVLLGSDGAHFFPCDLLSARRIIGVVERSDRLLALSSVGSVGELFPEGQCTEPQPPLLEGSP